MSLARFDVSRLRIVMHGISPAAAHAVAGGLETALTARLEQLRPASASGAIDNVDVGSIDVPRGIEQRVLIDAIAARLVDAIADLDRRTPARTGSRA
jgi:hypothetical protein